MLYLCHMRLAHQSSLHAPKRNIDDRIVINVSNNYLGRKKMTTFAGKPIRVVACDKKTGELSVVDENLDLFENNLKSLKGPDVRATCTVQDSTSRLKMRDNAFFFLCICRARRYKTYPCSALLVNFDQVSLFFVHIIPILTQVPNFKTSAWYSISLVPTLFTGKSFMLSLIVRYLSTEPELLSLSSTAFLDKVKSFKDKPSEGDLFEWKTADRGVTSGIWFFSKPFFVKTAGKYTAVLLMDTQGLFDTGTSAQCDLRVFGLSLSLSSHQILNVKGHIDRQLFDKINLFSSYANDVSRQIDEVRTICEIFFTSSLFCQYAQYHKRICCCGTLILWRAV